MCINVAIDNFMYISKYFDECRCNIIAYSCKWCFNWKCSKHRVLLGVVKQDFKKIQLLWLQDMLCTIQSLEVDNNETKQFFSSKISDVNISVSELSTIKGLKSVIELNHCCQEVLKLSLCRIVFYYILLQYLQHACSNFKNFDRIFGMKR
jgi:type III secretory pathway component EscU